MAANEIPQVCGSLFQGGQGVQGSGFFFFRGGAAVWCAVGGLSKWSLSPFPTLQGGPRVPPTRATTPLASLLPPPPRAAGPALDHDAFRPVVGDGRHRGSGRHLPGHRHRRQAAEYPPLTRRPPPCRATTYFPSPRGRHSPSCHIVTSIQNPTALPFEALKSLSILCLLNSLPPSVSLFGAIRCHPSPDLRCRPFVGFFICLIVYNLSPCNLCTCGLNPQPTRPRRPVFAPIGVSAVESLFVSSRRLGIWPPLACASAMISANATSLSSRLWPTGSAVPGSLPTVAESGAQPVARRGDGPGASRPGR